MFPNDDKPLSILVANL